MTNTPNPPAARETRARRSAVRAGLTLRKSRTREPSAADWGTFMLVDTATDAAVAFGLQSGYDLSIEDVERALAEENR